MAIKKTATGTSMQNGTQTNTAGNRMGNVDPNDPKNDAFQQPKTVVPQAKTTQATAFKPPPGYTRLSPGLYRDSKGAIVKQSQIPGTFAEPLKPPPAATTTPAKETPKTLPLPQNITPDATQQALAGGYRLPTQQELADMFQQRYEQEYADITMGAEQRQSREQAAREQMLADRGISIDSQAYRNEQQALAESRALEAAQARSQARQFAEGAVTSEFNRTLGAVGAAQEQRKIETAEKQWQKTYNLESKRIIAGIANDKNLTKIQKDQLTELVRSNRANEALKRQQIAAQAAGDSDSATRAADLQRSLRNERFDYLTRKPVVEEGRTIAGLNMSPEDAVKLLEKEERGGNTESQIRFRQG